MTMLTLGEAARLTGLGKTTIQRSIKAGRISASRSEFGSYQIDPAELHRVYPIKAETDPVTDPVERDAIPDAATDILVAELRAVISDLRRDRDRWQEAHAQAQAALTQAVTTTQRLLPSPLEQDAMPVEPPVEQDATPVETPRRRWWRRASA